MDIQSTYNQAESLHLLGHTNSKHGLIYCVYIIQTEGAAHYQWDRNTHTHILAHTCRS